MRPRLSAVISVLALLATFAVPSIVSADGAARGRLLVPGDHFNPGDELAISGTELDPGAALTLHLVNGATAVELGRATVQDDRTMTATLSVPAAFPTGYAELTATDASGTTWSTFVLIGDRPEGPSERAAMDERSLWLALLAAGLGVVAISLVVCRRAGGTGTAKN